MFTDNSEESSSVNVIELIVDTNSRMHDNNSNLLSNSQSVCINTPEITAEASADPEFIEEIKNIFEGCESGKFLSIVVISNIVFD